MEIKLKLFSQVLRSRMKKKKANSQNFYTTWSRNDALQVLRESQGESRSSQHIGRQKPRERYCRFPILRWNKQHRSSIVLKTLNIKIYRKQSQTLEWGNSLSHLPTHVFKLHFEQKWRQKTNLGFQLFLISSTTTTLSYCLLLTRQFQVPPHSTSAPSRPLISKHKSDRAISQL